MKSRLKIPVVVGLACSIVFGFLAYRHTSMESHEHLRMTRAAMSNLVSHLNRYRAVCGHFPSTTIGLQALSEAGGSLCPTYTPAPKGAHKDEWGNSFIYESDGNTFRLMSMGNEWLQVSADGNVQMVVKPD